MVKSVARLLSIVRFVGVIITMVGQSTRQTQNTWSIESAIVTTPGTITRKIHLILIGAI